MARTITISVGDELQDYAQQLVDSGQYASVSEVMRDSLRTLQEKQAESKLTLLRELIDEGEQSGEPVEVDAESFLKEAQPARKHG